jgi:hypothetical protein
MRIALLIVILCTGAAHAAPVTLVFSGGGASDVQVTARRLDAQDVAPVIVAVKTDAQTRVELADGHWSIDAESEEWWHSEQLIFVSGQPLELEIPLLPAGYISGTVKTRDGELPPELLIRTDETSRELPCPIVEKTFRCKVPAGVVDLRVRATAIVPRYFHELAVERGQTASLGEVVLERGASLSGTVVVAGEAKDVRISAASASGRYVTTPGRRGHFHIGGLTPGTYRVLATAADGALSSEEMEITILADRLAELRDPLLVEAPRRMRVAVTPPLDPWGEPWQLVLTRVADDVLAAKASASETGEWTSPLRSGSYRLEAGPQRGGTWLSREIEMSGEPLDLPLHLAGEKITGTVTYGDRTLKSLVRFRAGTAAFVEVETDDEGRIETALPAVADAQWTAVVLSDHPKITRTFEGIAPRGTVDLHVPVTTLSGVVLRPDGEPAPHALVNIAAPKEPSVQTVADDRGWFQAQGLAPGAYRVFAHDFLLESDIQTAEVTDSLAPDPIQLVLRDVEKVAGRIVADGRPVPGAKVTVYALDVPQQFTYPMTTNERGLFGSWAPPGAREIDFQAGAHGFDYRMFRTPVPGRMIDVPMRQEGGPITFPARSGELVPILQHNGAWSWPGMLVSEGFGRESRGQIVIGPMEPGPYSLCYIRGEDEAALRAGRIDRAKHCREGFLPPRGALTFTAPRVRAEERVVPQRADRADSAAGDASARMQDIPR